VALVLGHLRPYTPAMSTHISEQTTIVDPSTEILGTVEGIFITPEARGPIHAVERVRAVEGRGLEGDRYHAGIGTYSQTPGTGRQMTLIDAAALDALQAEHGIALAPGASRRNLVVRGADLDALIGRRFWIGEVLCEGMRACPPCGHLETLAGPGVAKALIGRGGLRAEIRRSGTIRVGDAIRSA
jgi:MOSC domain-containing protein YiiM